MTVVTFVKTNVNIDFAAEEKNTEREKEVAGNNLVIVAVNQCSV